MTDLVGMPPPSSPSPSPLSSPTADEKNFVVLAHLSAFFAPFLVPLIIYFTKAKESAWVRAQTVDVLNFHITIWIAYVVSGVLACFLIGFVLMAVVYVGGGLLAIVAAMKAYNGEAYRYPLTLKLVQ